MGFLKEDLQIIFIAYLISILRYKQVNEIFNICARINCLISGDFPGSASIRKTTALGNSLNDFLFFVAWSGKSMKYV